MVTRHYRSIFDITYSNNPVKKQNEEATFIHFMDFTFIHFMDFTFIHFMDFTFIHFMDFTFIHFMDFTFIHFMDFVDDCEGMYSQIFQ